MFDTLYSITITQAAAALRAGELTSAALVRHALEAVLLHDGTLNAMLHVSASALEEAERCDAEAAQGSFRGPLHGIPLVIKDNIDVRGLPTTVASPLFTHAAPAKADAVAVAACAPPGPSSSARPIWTNSPPMSAAGRPASAQRSTRGIPSAVSVPAAPQAGPQRPSQPVTAPEGSARTPAAPSGSRRAGAACTASAPPRGKAISPGSTPEPQASIPWGQWPVPPGT